MGIKFRQFSTKLLKLVKRRESHCRPLIVGDRVMLNSGGPTMLIVDTSELDRVAASWIDADGTMSELDISPDCLSLI